MRSPLPFWIAFLLAFVDTAIKAAIVGGLVPMSPPIYLNLCLFAMTMILWTNSVFTNPLRVATATGQVIPLPTLADTAATLARATPVAPPSSHVAVVVDLPAGTQLPAIPPKDPPKGETP